jgi:hypothetical protein
MSNRRAASIFIVVAMVAAAHPWLPGRLSRSRADSRPSRSSFLRRSRFPSRVHCPRARCSSAGFESVGRAECHTSA